MEERKKLNTRQARREAADSKKAEGKKKRKPKVRLIPIWVRLLFVIILLVLSLLFGLMFGYGVIGNGEASDALKATTWYKLIELIRSGT